MEDYPIIIICTQQRQIYVIKFHHDLIHTSFNLLSIIEINISLL